MKTKIMMLLAAVLLSASAFAQSENNEPLKGDVNGDGKVDVADITAVIKIMKDGGGTGEQTKYYWYVGTEKPTSLSQATIVEEYESPYTFTNPSTTEKCYVYVLTNADKEIIFSDPAMPFIPATKTEDITTIPGYKITQTGVRIGKGGSVLINVLDDGWKHFYVGTTQPTAENYETLIPQYSSLSDMNDATIQVPSNGKIYVMLPYQDSPNQSQIKRAFTDSEGNIVTCIERTGDEETIPWHMIWELTFEPGTTLTFKEPTTYYYSAGTEEVTTSNYTTANNAQSVTSISQIPRTIDGTQFVRTLIYFVLPSSLKPQVVASNVNIVINIVATTNGHTIYVTDSKVAKPTITIVNA